MAVRRFVSVAAFALMAWMATACQMPLPAGAQARTQSGVVLFAPDLPPEVRADRERKLESARAALAADPGNRDAAIWVGRRLGYLGQYREAIRVYSQALKHHIDDPFLLRHRGHRYLSVRGFEQAEADFALAAVGCRTVPDEVEPDGLPVPGRPPHSSLHFNVWYHYGLVLFLSRSPQQAEAAWLACLACCTNDESRVAVTHWLWCARMRGGDVAGAAACVDGITADMDIVENRSYHQLCLLYAGKLSRDAIDVGEGSSGAALRFGLAHYDLVIGDREAARCGFEALGADPGWAAFGVIAAEVELARW